MEVIVVIGIAGVILAVLVVGLGSVLGRSRSTDELDSERGAGTRSHSEDEGMGAQPVRDRPAGPGAEPQQPDAGGGELHPPEQQGEADEAAMPSEAAGKRDPGRADDDRS